MIYEVYIHVIHKHKAHERDYVGCVQAARNVLRNATWKHAQKHIKPHLILIDEYIDVKKQQITYSVG